MRHAGENHVGPLGMNEADEPEPGVTDTLALQTMDLDPTRDGLGSGGVFCDQAEMDFKLVRVEMPCQLRRDTLGAAATEVGNQQQ